MSPRNETLRQGKGSSKRRGKKDPALLERERALLERERAARLCLLEQWMSVEFRSFGRWVSPDAAGRIARRAMPGFFEVIHGHPPAGTWAVCNLTKRQIVLPHTPLPIFVVLHELAHAWCPVMSHGRAFLDSYQARVWDHWENKELSRAFEAGCLEILKPMRRSLEIPKPRRRLVP